MRVKGMANGLVKIFEKETGHAVEVYPIDAKDLLKSKQYVEFNPKLIKKGSKLKDKNLNVDNSLEDENTEFDLESMSRSELLEFAEKKFGEELNNRYGETRLRVEVKKLIEQAEIEDKEEIENEEEEEIDLTK